MLRGVGDIVSFLSQLLPPWMMAVLAVVILLAGAPFWLHSVRIKQISGAVRRMVRADDHRRRALAEQVMALAGAHPKRLIAAAEQAIRYSQLPLKKQALDRLEETGQAPDELKRLRQLTKPEAQPIAHPLEVAVGVEGLLEQGMKDTARHRLDEALKKHPKDPDLNALKSKF